MPRYVVERTFPDGLRIPVADGGAEICRSVVERNSEEAVTWVHSYVGQDKTRSFCVYDAPNAEAIRKTADPDTKYVRVFEWVAPFYCYIATGAHESRLFKAWHPIDDYNCYTFYIHFDPHRPIDPEAIYSNWGHRTSPPDYKTGHSLANMHLQDRELMERGNFSGVAGASIQDRAVQESMGSICDRTQEHLGTSDKAVIFYRRLLLEKLKDMAEGKPLPAHDPSLSFDQRAYSSEMPAKEPWQDVAKWQTKLEQQKPPMAAE